MEHPRTKGLEQQDHASVAQPVVPDRFQATGLILNYDGIAHDSAGQVTPSYEVVSRPAGLLACGELVIEPWLGPVRVVDVQQPQGKRVQTRGFVRIAWSDDHGPGQPSARYRASRRLPVRVPSHEDRLLIRQGIEQANWKRQKIAGPVARLIAAHLHTGPATALYGFAVNGQVSTQLFDELDHARNDRPSSRRWVGALVRHCLARRDHSPVPGWGLEPLLQERRTPAKSRTAATSRAARSDLLPTAQPALLPLPVDTVAHLVDAAFGLGLAISRSELSTRTTRKLIHHYAANSRT